MRHALLCFGLCCAGTVLQAGTVTLINNSDFESGNTSGWTTQTLSFPNTTGSCNDGFAAQSAGTGCIAGTSPIFGTFAAYSSTSFPVISNDLGEWINRLNQDFVVPVGLTNASLTFENTTIWGGSGGFRGVNVEVAIMQGATSVDTINVVVNPQNSGNLGWTLSTTDLTSVLTPFAGQTLTLQLISTAYFDTRSPPNDSSATTLTSGWDNVQITATTGSVPEPATWASLAGGLVILAAARRRYQTRHAGPFTIG